MAKFCHLLTQKNPEWPIQRIFVKKCAKVAKFFGKFLWNHHIWTIVRAGHQIWQDYYKKKSPSCLACRQIWLVPLVNDSQYGYITKSKRRKKPGHEYYYIMSTTTTNINTNKYMNDLCSGIDLFCANPMQYMYLAWEIYVEYIFLSLMSTAISTSAEYEYRQNLLLANWMPMPYMYLVCATGSDFFSCTHMSISVYLFSLLMQHS